MRVAYHDRGHCILCRFSCISNIVLLLYVVCDSWWMDCIRVSVATCSLQDLYGAAEEW